jgi:hypothetical protein
VSAGVMAALIFFQPQTEEEGGQYVVIVGSDNTTENVTLTEMLEMTGITKNSSYQNSYGNIRGQGIYTGVKVSDLVDLVGGMKENEAIRVTASDDYSMTFEYYKVYPGEYFLAKQGEMILAYEYNGTMVPNYEDGFRIAFLPDDGYYSNLDANATTEPNPSAAGPQWVSNVVKIEVIDSLEPVALTIKYGATTTPLTLSKIQSLPLTSGQGGYRSSFPSIKGPYDITGVSFGNLLDQFVTLPTNYSLIAVAGDDYSVEYTKTMVEGELSGYNSTGSPVDVIHSTMVLAYEMDGGPISGSSAPLRTTFINEDGNLTDGFLWVGNVVNITIVEEPVLSLIYDGTILSFTMSELKALTSNSGQGGYKTSGGSIRGPYDITGVAFSTLLSLLPALPANYTLTAFAGDGYSRVYTKTMVEGTINGYNAAGSPVGLIYCTMVLAYEIDGSPISGSSAPLRITFLNVDGNLTDGSLWVGNVVTISIVEVPLSPTLQAAQLCQKANASIPIVALPNT